MDSEFIDALLRAQADAVYKRPLTDDEWAAKRENRSHPLDKWLVLAVARVALERAADVADAEARTCRSDAARHKPNSAAATGAMCMEIGGESSAKSIAAAILALLPPEKEPT